MNTVDNEAEKTFTNWKKVIGKYILEYISIRGYNINKVCEKADISTMTFYTITKAGNYHIDSLFKLVYTLGIQCNEVFSKEIVTPDFDRSEETPVLNEDKVKEATKVMSATQLAIILGQCK